MKAVKRHSAVEFSLGILIFLFFLIGIVFSGCKKLPDLPNPGCFSLYWEIAGEYQDICICPESSKIGNYPDICNCSSGCDPLQSIIRLNGDATSMLLAAGIDGDLLDIIYRDPVISFPAIEGICWYDTSFFMKDTSQQQMITTVAVTRTGIELQVGDLTFDDVVLMETSDNLQQFHGEYWFAPECGIVKFTRTYITSSVTYGGELESWKTDNNMDCDCTELPINLFPVGNNNIWNWKLHGEQDSIDRTYMVAGDFCEDYLNTGEGQHFDYFMDSPLNPSAETKNPETFSTSIEFINNRLGHVSVNIFSITGKQVKTLYNGTNVKPGKYIIVWDGTDDLGKPTPPGIYTVVVTTGAGLFKTKLICLG